MASDLEEAPAPAAMDPEAEFLASGKRTGDDWERFKENVRPLKRGRNVDRLNSALTAHGDPLLRKSLLEQRRKMIDAIDEYEGEDPLQPWLDCIKWVQESFPAGGECSGLMVIYEQCVRMFWHEQRYKDDLRYLKLWLEYAENCYDAEVIYRFLEANNIGQSHACFYSSYALQMESMNKMNKADEIFNLGIFRKAQPLSKLEEKYRSFILRVTRKSKDAEEGPMEDDLSAFRIFGTLLSSGETRLPVGAPLENARNNNVKPQRPERKALFPIYNDNAPAARNKPEITRTEPKIWSTLGTQNERNKENTSIPAKWTSYKVPQKSIPRPVPPVACIEVYVDGECAGSQETTKVDRAKPCKSKLKCSSSHGLKRDSELLKNNPLRNFPASSLPR